MKRRDAIKLLGTSGATLAGGAHAESDDNPSPSRKASLKPEDAVRLVILHTNDIHGHLLGWRGWEGDLKDKMIGGAARLATAIAQERKKAPKTNLLLDAGDLIGDTMIADLTEGEALIKVFNHLKYDALTFGNHEPDFGIATLRERMKEAEFPFVAANLVTKQGAESFAAPYLIRKLSGLTVGLLGLTYPKTPWTTAKKNVAEVAFQDPVEAARRELPKLRAAGAQVVVVISHLGLSGDQKLAQEVEGIDIIVGGHSHNRMQQAERIGETLIVQAGAHGSDLGRLELEIVGGRMSEESPVDSLFADIIRKKLAADLAFLPGVGYGVAIPPGPISAAQLRQLIPHEGKLVTMNLSGSNVRKILEQAVENVFTADANKKVGGMIQCSGIRFEYFPSGDEGHSITKAECADGELARERQYVVATNTMLANGGHNQQTFLRGEALTEHGSQFEIVKRWIASNSPVSTPDLGRIAALTASKTK